ncbi:hypothetical protein DL96DRAFT_1105693 [Flagelloscypha sp. PMI_526]|nr:hypothetical protein DL96DRAFT_1105693 [Flagelloscypha sp. PMI_526]
MQVRVLLPVNARYTYKPAVVTYPTSADQVAEVVKLGGQYHLSVVARSGGHSYIAAGTGGQDNAILVDLSKNKQITIDNAAGTAVIQTGNRLGDVASALNAQGRAMPHGSCAYVGIGGHGSFGGFGFQSRMWGLVLDVIQSATLVLPNGTVSTVSSSSYPELFWGVRGAAPSFGIVYSATYKTFAAPTNNLIYQLGWSATIAEASKIISAWQSFALTGNVPATFGGELNIGSGSSRGRIGIDLFCAFWGPAADFDALIQKFTSQVPSTVKVTSAAKKTTGSWLTALGVIMGSLSTTSPEDKDTFYAKSLLTPTATPMTDAAITAWVTYLANTGFDSDTSWFTQILRPSLDEISSSTCSSMLQARTLRRRILLMV